MAVNAHRYVSQDTVLDSLEVLVNLEINRTDRSQLMSLLLLKAQEAQPQSEFRLQSTGPESVADQLFRFFKLAPDTSKPDVNPFGSQRNRLEYLTPGYERRGTYTQLYDGRAMSSLVQSTRRDGALYVRIPQNACFDLATNMGLKVPLEATAAFLLRNEIFDEGDSKHDLIRRFQTLFHLSDSELGHLFETIPAFNVSFSDSPFVYTLDSLPERLRPNDLDVSQSSVSAASHSIDILKPNDTELIISEDVWRRVRTAVATSRAVSLVGLPGTAKSALWANLLDQAVQEPSFLGLQNPPKYVCYTAEMDWTARTVVGGYYPSESGQLVFCEGYLLQAIRNNQILWIDELNRADLDRILGPILTFLAGQNVDLDQSHLDADETKSMLLTWSNDPESHVYEQEDGRIYAAGTDWRMLGTYNNVDRGRVFTMGSALTRRWAVVPVPPIDANEFHTLAMRIYAREPVIKRITEVYGLHLRFLPMGPAPFLDMTRYTALNSEPSTSSSCTQIEDTMLRDSYVIYMAQQLVRLDPDQRSDFLSELGRILGEQLAEEIDNV